MSDSSSYSNPLYVISYLPTLCFEYSHTCGHNTYFGQRLKLEPCAPRECWGPCRCTPPHQPRPLLWRSTRRLGSQLGDSFCSLDLLRHSHIDTQALLTPTGKDLCQSPNPLTQTWEAQTCLPKSLLIKLGEESRALIGRTDPFNGGGRVSGGCAAKLCSLALLDVQHWGTDGGHGLGTLCSCRRRHISQKQLKMKGKVYQREVEE